MPALDSPELARPGHPRAGAVAVANAEAVRARPDGSIVGRGSVWIVAATNPA
jgi:hypothetical protein